MAELGIIIPAYNEAQAITTTLDSLVRQETNRSFRVYVIDNNSTDDTPTAVQSYDQPWIQLHFEEEIQSSYAARNTGIQNASEEVLAFLDADMTVPENWVDAVLTAVENTDVPYLGTDVDLRTPQSPSMAARFDQHTGFPIKQYIKHQQFAPTCCLITRRWLFEELGLFDQRLVSGGDKEFGNRVHNAGYQLGYAPEVTAYHPTRNSVRALIDKDFRVGRGLCQLQRYHPDRYGSPGIPPRPSGIKRPEQTLPITDRAAFSTLSTILTGVRGLGYYQEYIRGETTTGEIPTLN